MPGEDTKQCPFCAELVKKDARICRYCHMDFVTCKPVGAITSPAHAPKEIQARSSVADGVKLGCGMFIILPALIIAGLIFAAVFFGVIGTSALKSGIQQPTGNDDAMLANEALTAAHNKGWHWANDNKIETVKRCEELLNADERYGCNSFVKNMVH